MSDHPENEGTVRREMPCDPQATADRIDVVCDAFERAWAAGRRLRLEEFLADVAGPKRALLLAELLHIELAYRRQSGEQPTPQEYLARFPHEQQTIEDGFRVQTRNAPIADGFTPGSLAETVDRVSLPASTVVPGAEVPLAGRPQAPSATARPERIGRYRVQRELGAGGFGTVYLGYDERMERSVAIKVPTARLLASDRAREEFLREAQSVARLRHPGVVVVHDFGEDADGSCYIVYEFIEGLSLTDRLKQGRLPLDEAARLVAQVAEALHHAHLEGLVHRDIKPANILLDKKSRPFLSDFGLAIREDELARQRGAVIGTPAYMSPEQIRGEGHRTDPRTDIYALGTVLYQLLCHRLPFLSTKFNELCEQIQECEPRPPRTIDDAIPRDLERICLKAMSKRMCDRYTTARDMADELRQTLLALEAPAPSPPAPPGVLGIVPKGLRSFDEHDKDFFLELLPGPRDRDGLPDSLRFWKTRIDSRDVETTFSVGLIYGPSGCGKSSLVRAGLLPRLPPSVVPVYVEAAQEGTEARLARALLRACPELKRRHQTATEVDSGTAEQPGGGSTPRGERPDSATRQLLKLVADLRRNTESHGRKVLIVLDQFEQWLHAHGTTIENTELLAALRQADGVHVQFLVMVRDDFWLGVSRLFRELEVPLLEGRNVQLVDLFDLRHARRVLELFGQAFGCLPERITELSSAQHAFLDQVVDGLSENGKVVSVRLSLFADMMKGRPWIPQSLHAVGGTHGIGLTFLDETFSSRTASPEHRTFEKPVRGVLAALLPEAGSDIKGQMRSRDELLAASALTAQPERFERLLGMLDAELRIITPTEPTGVIVEGTARAGSGMVPGVTHKPGVADDSPAAAYYQLTHDYLVPPLREWLTQKQRETWRGRAELRIAELARSWARRREGRFLPNPLEFVSISTGVPRRKRSHEQQQMMQAATRRYATIAAVIAFLITLSGWVAWDQNGRIRADGLVQQVHNASVDQLPETVAQLEGYRRWANRPLQDLRAQDSEPDIQFRAAMSLLPVDHGQVPFLRERMLDPATDPSYETFAVIRKTLAPHRAGLLDDLWHDLRHDQRPQSRFRAGLALAEYDHGGTAWSDEDSDFLADQLLTANPVHQSKLRALLMSIRKRLLRPLETAFLDEKARGDRRLAAATALAEFAGDEPDRLAALVGQATAEQYPVLFAQLTGSPASRETAEEVLRERVARQPPADADETPRLRAGQQRAGAAITLIRMGERDAGFPCFRVLDDAEPLTQFVHRLRQRDVTADAVSECLHQATDDSVRFALLLSLGEFEPADFTAEDWPTLKDKLLSWYREEPSSAIHGACGWLLRKWTRDLVKPSPGEAELLQQRMAQVDHSPQHGYDPTGTRQWFVFPLGRQSLTFVVISAGEFRIGSPESEPDRGSDESQQRVRLTRPFAISDREMSWGQVEEFVKSHGGGFKHPDKKDPRHDYPAVGVEWPDAVRYCRWLTEQTGMSEADQCHGEVGGPNQDRFDPTRPGFRLPTEAEWEFACRGGMSTSFSFGNDRGLLAQYGWYSGNASNRPHVGAELRPNLRGLFDMYGNVLEVCQDWYVADSKAAAGEPAIDPLCFIPPAAQPTESDRVRRGGSFASRDRSCRSACRRAGYEPERAGVRIVVGLTPNLGSAAAAGLR